MSEVKIGQHWQATSSAALVRNSWDNAVILEVIALIGEHKIRCKYIHAAPKILGYETEFYDSISHTPNFRLVRTCIHCMRCWVKDPLDAGDGFITCWQCEIDTATETIGDLIRLYDVTDSMKDCRGEHQ
jgi:hypothetical protein